jgi:hypothetical protein
VLESSCKVINQQKLSNTEDDSSTFSGAFWLGIAIAVVSLAYEASGGHLSDGTLYSVTTSIVLLYLVTGPFRQHWKRLRFWLAIFLVFGVHAAILHSFVARLRGFNFWGLMMLIGPEGLAMILVVGLIVGDNYFTRNTRKAQADAKGLSVKAHAKP